MQLLSVLLMFGGGQAGQPQNPIMQFAPIVLIGVVFYFFMIRPQAKRAKEQRTFIDEVKKGDKVVTNSGIHGKIVEVNDTDFLIEVDTNTKIKFDKSVISYEVSKNLNK